MRTLDRISPFWRGYAAAWATVIAFVATVFIASIYGISTYQPEPMSTHFKTAMETPHDPR